MGNFAIRRIVLLVPTVLVVTTLVFTVFRLVPGDPTIFLAGPEATARDQAEIRKSLGLDKPVGVQYFIFMKQAARGDFGKSQYSRRPVIKEIAARYPYTLLLACASIAVAATLGVALGVLAAVRHASIFDYGSMVLAIAGVSLPNFWLGLLFMLLFSVKLHWLPTSGSGEVRHLILPAITLGLPATAVIARLTRSTMLETLHQDYIRTAHAKGLGRTAVILRHGLRNSLIPTITVIGLNFGNLLGGSVIAETLFSWPGIGFLLINAVRGRDYPVVTGVVFVFSITFILINALVDILYGLIDPRIRHR
jgi:peptide/nickel transport system permease protein